MSVNRKVIKSKKPKVKIKKSKLTLCKSVISFDSFNKAMNVQVCDARNDEKSYTVWPKIIQNIPTKSFY
jgi:hypothetical protein